MPILKPMHLILATVSLIASCGTTPVPVADDAAVFRDVQAGPDAGSCSPVGGRCTFPEDCCTSTSCSADTRVCL